MARRPVLGCCHARDGIVYPDRVTASVCRPRCGSTRPSTMYLFPYELMRDNHLGQECLPNRTSASCVTWLIYLRVSQGCASILQVYISSSPRSAICPPALQLDEQRRSLVARSAGFDPANSSRSISPALSVRSHPVARTAPSSLRLRHRCRPPRPRGPATASP